MIQENETIVLLLGTGVLVFILFNRKGLRKFPEVGIFLVGYGFLFWAWLLTVLEVYLWQDTLNLLEHLSYTASSLMILIWSWKVFRPGNKKESRGRRQ